MLFSFYRILVKLGSGLHGGRSVLVDEIVSDY
jgi:hypothetical protein